MTHTLTAKEQTLDRIFSNDYVFTIPGYQRPYSWGKEQAHELLDDLLGALNGSPESIIEATPYFMGSIVLIKSDTFSEATVVDGQQRLTTLTLLLSAIRATVQDNQMQSGITKRIYEQGDVVSATHARYRLSLRERDREFFRQYIQHEGGIKELVALNEKLTDAQARLRSNAEVFMEGLAGLKQAELVRLVQFIITRCYLVTVATPDLDSAYRIFGVLNSRGLDLSATDILKAEIIGSIPTELRDSYTKKWEDQEEDLGRDDFGELFSHIRMVYSKAKPRGTLLKEFKEHVTAIQNPRMFLDDVLLPMAQAFGELRNADYASQRCAEKVNEHLSWLNRLEFKDWVPPALVYFVKHRNTPERVLSFFGDLERLGYSMLVRKSGVGERIERFSTLTSAIETGQNLEDIHSPLQLTPLEQYDTYTALNGPLYETHSSRALGILLLRLDRLLADSSANYQYDVVSVEHIMPQQPAPNSQWHNWVPDAQTHQRWVHRLGNLTLLSRKKNSAASNFEFEKKKTAYFTKGGTSSFALTTKILLHSTWTESVMQIRQDEIMMAFEAHLRLQDRLSRGDLAQATLDELFNRSADPVFELKSAKHGLSAIAHENGKTFIVQSGSYAKLEWTGPRHSYAGLRETLLREGALKLTADGERLVFTRDVVFNRPSAASATILARADNGRTTWCLKGSQVTYAAWQDTLPASQAVTGRGDL